LALASQSLVVNYFVSLLDERHILALLVNTFDVEKGRQTVADNSYHGSLETVVGGAWARSRGPLFGKWV
jgi:hypothetical protein